MYTYKQSAAIDSVEKFLVAVLIASSIYQRYACYVIVAIADQQHTRRLYSSANMSNDTGCAVLNKTDLLDFYVVDQQSRPLYTVVHIKSMVCAYIEE